MIVQSASGAGAGADAAEPIPPGAALAGGAYGRNSFGHALCKHQLEHEGGAFWCSIDTSKLPIMPDGSKQLLWDQAEVELVKERLQHAKKLQQEAKQTAKAHRPFFVAVGFHRPRNLRTNCLASRAFRIGSLY